MQAHADIRIGTLVKDGHPDYIRQIVNYGFESFQVNFWKSLDGIDPKKRAAEIKQVIAEAGQNIAIDCIGLYGNPLAEKAVAREFGKLIENARHFGATVVSGFAGRLRDVSIPENMKVFKQVWGTLAKKAEDHGVRIAFENCDMGGDWRRGDWNIANASTAWEMMFNEVPSPVLGLEWEPCHQLVSLADPLPQLRKWVDRVYHVHGKDASVHWDVIREFGIRSGKPYVYHRTPGFGDTNWTDVIGILRKGGFKGSIDIEGWHDPVYRDELEMTGQVHGLNYLKQCRGGPFIPNPVVEENSTRATQKKNRK